MTLTIHWIETGKKQASDALGEIINPNVVGFFVTAQLIDMALLENPLHLSHTWPLGLRSSPAAVADLQTVPQ